MSWPCVAQTLPGSRLPAGKREAGKSKKSNPINALALPGQTTSRRTRETKKHYANQQLTDFPEFTLSGGGKPWMLPLLTVDVVWQAGGKRTVRPWPSGDSRTAFLSNGESR